MEVVKEPMELILNGFGYTVGISVSAILFGIVLGALLCIMRLSRKKWHNIFAKYYIMIFRGFPPLLVLMMLFYVILAGLPPLMIAIIAFSIIFSTHFADLFYSSYRSVNPAQNIAGLSLGLSKYQTFRYVILPQMLHNSAPVLKDHVGASIKGTSIVGYIAIIDLTKAVDMIKDDAWGPLLPMILSGFAYFLLTWLSGKALDYILKKF